MLHFYKVALFFSLNLFIQTGKPPSFCVTPMPAVGNVVGTPDRQDETDTEDRSGVRSGESNAERLAGSGDVLHKPHVVDRDAFEMQHSLADLARQLKDYEDYVERLKDEHDRVSAENKDLRYRREEEVSKRDAELKFLKDKRQDLEEQLDAMHTEFKNVRKDYADLAEVADGLKQDLEGAHRRVTRMSHEQKVTR